MPAVAVAGMVVLGFLACCAVAYMIISAANEGEFEAQVGLDGVTIKAKYKKKQ